MQAAVLGTGGLGRIITLELASDPRVDEIVIADKRGDRSRALKSLGKTAAIQAIEADVTDPYALRRVLGDADVVVNATLPEYNLRVMQACFDVGASYVDTAGYSAATTGQEGGVLGQLALDAAWRDRGITGIVSMGSDPGISNIMARIASDRFSAVDAIRIRKAATGEKETDGFPLYSREIFLHDALMPPIVWEGAKFVEHPTVSGEEEYQFPAPIGPRRIHLFRHEEVFTLPRHLRRPVGWVEYKHDIRPELEQAIHAFDALGLLNPRHMVRLGSTQIAFRDAFLAVIPEPSTLIGLMAGALSIVVDVEGMKSDGSKGRVRASVTMEHREANRRRGTTAERFLTAAACVTGIVMILPKRAARHGVLAPEELDPEHLRPDLENRGVTFHIEELPA